MERVAEYFHPGANVTMGTTGVGVLPPPPELPPPPLEEDLEQAVNQTTKYTNKKTCLFIAINFYKAEWRFYSTFRNRRKPRPRIHIAD
jgi:hypothetical protein